MATISDELERVEKIKARWFSVWSSFPPHKKAQTWHGIERIDRDLREARDAADAGQRAKCLRILGQYK